MHTTLHNIFSSESEAKCSIITQTFSICSKVDMNGLKYLLILVTVSLGGEWPIMVKFCKRRVKSTQNFPFRINLKNVSLRGIINMTYRIGCCITIWVTGMEINWFRSTVVNPYKIVCGWVIANWMQILHKILKTKKANQNNWLLLCLSINRCLFANKFIAVTKMLLIILKIFSSNSWNFIFFFSLRNLSDRPKH